MSLPNIFIFAARISIESEGLSLILGDAAERNELFAIDAIFDFHECVIIEDRFLFIFELFVLVGQINLLDLVGLS